MGDQILSSSSSRSAAGSNLLCRWQFRGGRKEDEEVLWRYFTSTNNPFSWKVERLPGAEEEEFALKFEMIAFGSINIQIPTVHPGRTTARYYFRGILRAKWSPFEGRILVCFDSLALRIANDLCYLYWRCSLCS